MRISATALRSAQGRPQGSGLRSRSVSKRRTDSPVYTLHSAASAPQNTAAAVGIHRRA
jgi:hypothetical protein